MNFKSQSSAAIAAVLGQRLKQARLNIDITQSDVADSAGVSRKAVINAEKGQVKLEVLIAILKALDLTNNIDSLIPEQPISPLQLAKLSGKKRHRSSGTPRKKNKVDQTW
jgi:DNA-binding XRE family transcriptional regulator